jgi:hypothetical protein
MTARRTPDNRRPWRGIFCDGPTAGQDKEGDETPYWAVFVGDEDGKPVGKTYWPGTYAGAIALAEDMARDRQLELINEAQEA